MKNLSELITVQIILYEEDYNLIEKCLSNFVGLEIVIIDNKNDKNLKKQICENFKISKYICSNTNTGYSRGHNIASQYANTKYIFILNADCLINKTSILDLINFIEKDNKCGIVSPTTYDDFGNLTYNGGVFPENSEKINPIQIEGNICVNTVLGSSILISKKLFKELDGFDENFFLYFSDDDLCRKVKQKKLSTVQVFMSKAIHTHGIIKVKNIYKKTFLREFHFTFDELYYYYKNKINLSILNKYRKKIYIYLLKSILNVFLFRMKKSIYYFARFLAIIKFLRMSK